MCKSQTYSDNFSRFGRVFISGLLVLMFSTVLTFSTNAQSQKPSATFEKVWVDYDVTEGGRKGMRVHLKFGVRGMKGIDSSVRILFETGDGKKLRDKNKSFYATTGDVALFRALKIDYDPGYYEDLTLFMPYNELDLSVGEYDLKMDIDLIYKNGDLIQHLAFYDFVFTQPETEEDVPEAPMPNPVEDTTTSAPIVTYDKTWVEYGVTEGGKKGMRIHVKFNVENMKGVSSELRIRVMRQSGEFLKNSDFAWSNKEGELMAFKSLRPGFQATDYNDEKVFLPYDALKLGRGAFNLKLDIDLNYPNGTLIKHMGTYDFVYKNGVE